MKKCQSVLYVDDDPDICQVVQTTLCLIAGLDVQTANSGERAIDLAYELRPDLIILDVMMPELDGPSTYKSLCENTLLADIPVVFMTGKVLPTEVAHFLRLGAIGVIGKPFDPTTLGDEVVALWNKAVSARVLAGERAGDDQVPAQVDSLASRFLERARGEVIRLRELIASARPGDQATLVKIERLAHSIHGAGAIFGFPSVSALGADVERLVEELSTAEIASDQAAEPLGLQLLRCTERLAQEVDAAVASGPKRVSMSQDRSAAR
ncbi:MAG: response regulator receiver domain protein [Gammaproteobacteria bacterium]|nr:response regulator receiver domain protein [Gammaproteobacteria bacterium]